MEKYLVEVKINTDGDFRYEGRDSLFCLCDTGKEAEDICINKLKKLAETISSSREWVEESIKDAVNHYLEWLSYINLGQQLGMNVIEKNRYLKEVEFFYEKYKQEHYPDLKEEDREKICSLFMDIDRGNIPKQGYKNYSYEELIIIEQNLDRESSKTFILNDSNVYQDSISLGNYDIDIEIQKVKVLDNDGFIEIKRLR